MYWNHRVMRREVSPGLFHLFMVEVYYEDDDDSVIGWTEKESVWGDEEYDGVNGIRQTLHWMLDATEKPVLDEAEILAEQAANPRPALEYEGPYLSLDEVLESLGLDRDDLEPDS